MDTNGSAQDSAEGSSAASGSAGPPSDSQPPQNALFVYRSSHPGIANPIFEEAATAQSQAHAGAEQPESNRIIHYGVCCDGIHCEKAPPTNSEADFIHGPRFHCMVCSNFDLCERCATSSQSPHDKSHSMIKFARPKNRITVVHGSDPKAVRELLEALQQRDVCSPMEFLEYYSTMTADQQKGLMQALRSLDESEHGLLMQYLMALEATDRPAFLAEYQSYDDLSERMSYLRIVIGAELVVSSELECFDHMKVDLDKVEVPEGRLIWYNIRSLKGNVVLTVEMVPLTEATKKQREKGSLFHKDAFFGRIKHYEYPSDDGLYDAWAAGGLATRVLDLLPGENNDDLKCSIRPILSMGSGELLPYEALSYTWKETSYERSLNATLDPGYDIPLRNQMEILHKVFCDGGYLEIGTGLRDALLHLRHPTEKRTLWVDQLCINQHSLGERAHHVNLMRHIYNRARRVIVWTGEEDEDSKKAFHLIAALAGMSQAATASSDNGPLAVPARDSAEWLSLYKFFERPVFTRGWVVQEIALGQRVTVRCGKTEIDFGAVADIAAMLSQPSWQLVGENPKKRTSALHAYLIGLLRKRIHNCESMTLHQVLFETSKFGITEEKDRIYAFLGLLQRVEGGEVHINDYGIRPDYEKPARDVFIETTKAIILHDKTLDICGRTGIAGSGTTSAAKNLPSWVPDLGDQRERIYFSDPGVCSAFQAAKSMLPAVSWPFDERQDVMKSPSYIIDSVSTVSQQKHISQAGIKASFLEWSRMTSVIGESYPGGGSTVQAFSQTCTAIRTAIPVTMTWDNLFIGFISFFAAMAVLPDEDGKKPEEDDADMAENPLASQITNTCFQMYRDKPELTDPANSSSEDYITAAQHVIVATTPHRRFFITKKGYMGLGPVWMQPDDQVVILPGARVPFLLRRATNPVPLDLGDSVYRMMGECYVHGFMDGQACDGQASSWPNVFIY